MTIENKHDAILIEICAALADTEKNIKKQMDLFYKDPSYKTYTGIRRDKGYNSWKKSVLNRFDNTCCVCNQKDKLVAHHLYSYKYYPALRTDINNGVCICVTCHELFNELYTNTNTLDQFIQYRRRFNVKRHDEVREYILRNRMKGRPISTSTAKRSTVARDTNTASLNSEVVEAFIALRDKLWQEKSDFEKKYQRQTGIKIVFRGKTTTTLSAITTLKKEVMRINTLIHCNKMKDKRTMAEKFKMPHEQFVRQLEDPKEYLSFSAAEITHLNVILAREYTSEYQKLQNS